LDVGTPGPLVDIPLPPADPSVEPPTARAALEAFLQAEADGRADAAHALLTDEAKRSEGPAPAWQASRPDRLVPVAFQVTAERPTAEGVDFEVAATHTPVINPFVGFVPSRTQERWRVLRQQGDRWRVEPSPASVRPLLPAEGPAPDVAHGWLQRLAACDGAGAKPFQVGPVVYGPLDLLGAPCQEGGTWTTAAPVSLDRGEDPKELVAAFGPDVGRFVRLVPAQGPKTSVMVAVAPLGEDWRVLGVLAAPPAERR